MCYVYMLYECLHLVLYIRDMNLYVHACMIVCIYAYMHCVRYRLKFVCLYTYLNVYIDTDNAYTYIHTYMHTKYIQIQMIHVCVLCVFMFLLGHI